jgi:phage I-like protein
VDLVIASLKAPQRTAALSERIVLPLALIDGKAPAEFQIFSSGDNTSEKGIYLFDDLAAELVMAKYAQRGIDLSGDYEHQSLVDPPIEAPASIRRFVPQVRDGALWATSVEWTDRAAGYVERKEYFYFSPAFGFEELDDGRMRVTKLINVALTNNPALHNIEPLMAAKDDDMDEHEKLKAAHEKLTTAHEKLKSDYDELKGEHGELKAMCKELKESVKKLRASEPDGDEMKATAALRDEVKTITGKDDSREQIGVLRSIKLRASEADKAVATLRDIEQTTRDGEFDGLMTAALKDGKITKAQRDAYWDKKCRDGEKHVTVEGLAMLKDWLPTASVQANPTGGIQREGGGAPPSRDENKIMQRFGIRTAEDVTAFDKFRTGNAG